MNKAKGSRPAPHFTLRSDLGQNLRQPLHDHDDYGHRDQQEEASLASKIAAKANASRGASRLPFVERAEIVARLEPVPREAAEEA